MISTATNNSSVAVATESTCIDDSTILETHDDGGSDSPASSVTEKLLGVWKRLTAKWRNWNVVFIDHYGSSSSQQEELPPAPYLPCTEMDLVTAFGRHIDPYTIPIPKEAVDSIILSTNDDAASWFDYGPSLGLVQRATIQLKPQQDDDHSNALFCSVALKPSSLRTFSLPTDDDDDLMLTLRTKEFFYESAKELEIDFPPLVETWGRVVSLNRTTVQERKYHTKEWRSELRTSSSSSWVLPLVVPHPGLRYDPKTHPLQEDYRYQPSSYRVRRDVPLHFARVLLHILIIMEPTTTSSQGTTTTTTKTSPPHTGGDGGEASSEGGVCTEDHTISNSNNSSKSEIYPQDCRDFDLNLQKFNVDVATLIQVVTEWMDLYQQQDSELYDILQAATQQHKSDMEMNIISTQVTAQLQAFIAKESRSFLAFILSPEVVKDPLKLHHSDSFLSLGKHLVDDAFDEHFEEQTHVIDNQTMYRRQFLYKQRVQTLYPNIADMIFNPSDGSIVALAAGAPAIFDPTSRPRRAIPKSTIDLDQQQRSIPAKVAASAQGPWIDETLHLPPGIRAFTDPSVYVETNGTVTMVLDTCTARPLPLNNSCLTIVQSHKGCTKDGCDDFELVGMPDFLPVPRHCALSKDSPFYDCPCLIEQPTIWFDKPMQKWRLLFHQYPSLRIDGQCVPQPEGYSLTGGYAETTGRSLEGPWAFDYFRNAYNNAVRYDAGGERSIEVITYDIRERPRIILGPQGGLDGGFLVNVFCGAHSEDDEYDESSSIGDPESSEKSIRCKTEAQQVLKSVTTPDSRPSGTIYLVTHGDTSPAEYPTGLSRKGLEHAEFMEKYWSDEEKFDPPKTIISGRAIDPYYRGQRLFGTTSPLARKLGLNLHVGPKFLDDPYWTYRPDWEMLLMGFAAMEKGTTMLVFWCYVGEICHFLGSECDMFEKNKGEYHIFELEDGYLVNHEFATDGYAPNFKKRQKLQKIKIFGWNQLPWEIQDALETIGYTRVSWNKGQELDVNQWRQLSSTQQEAALQLGFEENSTISKFGIEMTVSSFYDELKLIKQ